MIEQMIHVENRKGTNIQIAVFERERKNSQGKFLRIERKKSP